MPPRSAREAAGRARASWARPRTSRTPPPQARPRPTREAAAPPARRARAPARLRARAIENLAYVVAPAQVGVHGRGRSSHGHAMIVDPWGTVLAQVAGGEGVALAELDFERQDRLRRELPALAHARLTLTVS